MTRNLRKTATRLEPVEESVRMSSEDRRRQLIRVAIRLFSRKGFSGTTTKEIAMAAGVNEAIIFRHFATKDDLYAAILEYKASEEPIEDWLNELRPYTERRDDEGLFRALAAKILEHHRRDLDFVRLMFYSSLEGHELAKKFREQQIQPIHDFLRDYIARRQKEGAFRRCNPSVAVRAFVGMPLYHTLVSWLFTYDTPVASDEEATEAFAQLIVNGLRLQPSKQPGVKASKKNR